MKTVEVDQTSLSQLVDAAVPGEEVIVTRAGKPVAKLVKFEEQTSTRWRTPGAWKGKVWMAPDFDTVDEEITRLFEGEDDDLNLWPISSTPI